MKICIIENIYPPYDRGGAEQVIAKTVQGLLNAGHEVMILTSSPKGDEYEKHERLRIYRRRPRNLYFYTDAHHHGILSRFAWHFFDIFNTGVYFWIKKVLQEEQPDVVHTHNLMGLSFLIPRAIRSLSLRHIHTVHDVQLVEPSAIILKEKENSFRYSGWPTRLYTALMRALIGSPHVVISPSQFLLDFYTARGFFSASKRIVLRNPMTFTSEKRVEPETRDSVFRFLYVGQIEQHKGVMLLVDTFLALLRETNMVAELHIVGNGSLFADIKERVAGSTHIHMHGRVDRRELPKLFSQVHLTVAPSLCYENSPTVIFESLYFGVPVLASSIEGIAELIHEGKNGFTFVAGNKESLREKMMWCIEHPEELVRMQQTISSQPVGLSQDAYIDRLIDLYHRD